MDSTLTIPTNHLTQIEKKICLWKSPISLLRLQGSLTAITPPGFLVVVMRLERFSKIRSLHLNSTYSRILKDHILSVKLGELRYNPDMTM